MPTLAQSLLPVLDLVRGISGILGFRPTSITVRVVTWTGSRPGLGTSSYVDTPLWVATDTSSPQNPRVVPVTNKDILASGGLYTNEDVKVGPLTPSFPASAVLPGGGYTPGQINPPQPVAGSMYQEIHFQLAGGGYQVPVWFQRIGDSVISATRYFVVLRRSGNQNPGVTMAPPCPGSLPSGSTDDLVGGATISFCFNVASWNRSAPPSGSNTYLFPVDTNTTLRTIGWLSGLPPVVTAPAGWQLFNPLLGTLISSYTYAQAPGEVYVWTSDVADKVIWPK